MEDKVNKLIRLSREVFNDCFLENGAVIAANTDKEYYPKSVNNYRFVWPRDAAFALYAANILGIDFYEKFAKWLLSRAEGFKETGLLWQRYATNGAKDQFFGYQYQADQAGALLWSFLDYIGKRKTKSTKIEKAIKLIADGLCNKWNKTGFGLDVYDLWEEQKAISKLKGNFIYTLASCSYGLMLAYKRYKKAKWLKASEEMKRIITKAEKKYGYYPKLTALIDDDRIDASSLGLIWPFDITSNKKAKEDTIRFVEKKLSSKLGIKRYEHDYYCSNILDGDLWKQKAGFWPLLMFWNIIALDKTGYKARAKKMFLDYIKNFDSYIPEQVFDNKVQKSVNGLLWAHAMFVIAAKRLGFV